MAKPGQTDWIRRFTFDNIMPRTRSGRYYGRMLDMYNPNAVRARMRQRNARSATITQRRRRRPRPTGGVTEQYDRKTIYVKRRMPLRQKRRWKRFSRKVTFVSQKSLGTRTIVMNDATNREFDFVATPTAQVWGQVCLWGAETGTASMLGGNDLQAIANANSSVNGTGMLNFHSAVLDITFTNVSHQTVDSIDSPWNVKLEVDVYEVTGSRTFVNSGNGGNLLDVYTWGASDTSNIAGAATGLTQTQRGVTPFDFPTVSRTWGIKIWRKTKYIMSHGESATYQFRDPRYRSIQKNNIDDNEGTNFPGLTRWILFVIKPQVGVIPDAGIPAAFPSLTIGATRKYSLKVNSAEACQDMYNN